MKFLIFCGVLFVIAIVAGTYYAVIDFYIFSSDSIDYTAVFVVLSIVVFIFLGYINQIKNSKTISRLSAQEDDNTDENKNSMPTGWWLLSAGVIVWVIGYWIVLYPTDQPTQTDKYDNTVVKHIEKYRYTLKNIDKNGLETMGQTLFLVYCVSCHGADAEGMQGIARDLTLPKYQDYAVAGLTEIIKRGKKGKIGQMPAFKGELTDTQIEAVSAYILSLGVQNSEY